MLLPLSLLPFADFDGHMDWDGGWGVLMMIGMVLFWALVIFGIVWLVREIGGSRAAQTNSERDSDPIRTLDRRLAEGAISPDDYRERRAILEERQAQPGE
ncbi:MAG: hypothetical protein BroJett024_43360 [Alphaproteobacteria bacterium]|nr:MAG: hypothetical protein BroJett024_43360 [Alphaproteobacteria bacterium]